MKITVTTFSTFSQAKIQECKLVLDIDSKHTMYYLISIINSKCYVDDLPYLAKFTHNEKELKISDLNMTIEAFFGNAEATTLDGYYTDEGTLSPNQLKEYRAHFRKTQRSQKFNQSIGLAFFNPNVTDIIKEYYKEYPPYVVVNVPHALNIPTNTIHLGNEFAPQKPINLWSLVISFFYQMLNIQLSSAQPGQLIVRGDALLKANNKFISYHEDLESAKAACKKPMVGTLGPLENYNLIFCLNSRGFMRGLYFNIYFPSDRFSEYLSFVDLGLKSKWNLPERDLQASFASHILFLVNGVKLNSHPDFQGGIVVELQTSCPYSDIAMDYFISHQPEPRLWKKGVHNVDDIIKAALKEDGPNRKLILALLKEDGSWFENKDLSEIRWGILEHFEQANSEENQIARSLCL